MLLVFTGQLFSKDLEEIDTFSYGNWTGGAYRLANGSFSHCHIATAYENGVVLAIALTDENEINLLIVKKSWNLPLDRSFQASLSIDGKSLGNYYAIATDDTSLQIDIGNNAEFFKKLRLGNKLVYESENDILSFGLRGTNKALGKVRECVDQASSSQSSQ
jgi:hypothetical protein